MMPIEANVSGDCRVDGKANPSTILGRRKTALILTCSILCACSGTTSRGSTPSNQTRMIQQDAPLVRGSIGDTVRMVVNHVRADKREQFEFFMREILHPAMTKAAPNDPETADHIPRARMLRAVRPDADGTFQYVFLVDPAGHGGPYNFTALIQRMYPPAEAAEKLDLYRSALARPSDAMTFVNAEW